MTVYNLTANVTVSSGNGYTLTGDNEVYLNGYEIKSTANAGNTWDYGITCTGKLVVHGPGKINGFRVGIKAEGASSEVLDVDVSNNRYFGVWFEGDNSKMLGGRCTNIGGVTDEAYAIAVQIGEATGCTVQGVHFEELYRQNGVSGTGEGLAINFSASSTNCSAQNCTVINYTRADHTYGVFMGSGGGHSVKDFYITNCSNPIAKAVSTDITDNVHYNYFTFPDAEEEPPAGQQLISQSLGTIIGDMTSSSAAFDGTTSKASTACANNGTGVVSYIGKVYTSSKTISGFKYWGSSDKGVNNTASQCEVQLWGKNGTPSSSTDGTYLGGSGTVSDTNGFNYSKLDVTPTGFTNVWVRIISTNTVDTKYAAQVEFYEG